MTRVLVIDDNEANLELMLYLLRAHGFETVSARDGREGLVSCLKVTPDLVICDIGLPMMSGYEVARQLKLVSALKGVPLVAVTAYAMKEDEVQSRTAGFDGYLTKPIDPEAFVDQVQAFLKPEQRRGREAAPAAAAMAALVPSGERTILAVDDNEANLDLAASLLGSSGFRVEVARSLKRALEMARANPPDLILSDMRMGGGHGLDFIRQVKAEPALRAIPFLFLTSTYTSERDRERGLAAGAVRYLFRPIDPHDLLREIRACLSGTGAA